MDDSALIPTLVNNTTPLLNSVSPRVANPHDFDVDLVVNFLEALTADSARDLSGIVPTSVPSRLPIDQP